MKVIVAGGRDFIPYRSDRPWLINLLQNELHATELVCGMCRGADMWGHSIAKEMGLPIREFPADWDVLGKRAGYARNVEMAKYADACVILPGGKGTDHMKNIAQEKGLRVIIWEDSWKSKT